MTPAQQGGIGAETGERAGLQVLDEHVCLVDQAGQRRLAFGAARSRASDSVPRSSPERRSERPDANMSAAEITPHLGGADWLMFGKHRHAALRVLTMTDFDGSLRVELARSSRTERFRLAGLTMGAALVLAVIVAEALWIGAIAYGSWSLIWHMFIG